MRFLVQRVKQAEVKVDGEVTGSIGHGFLVLVGIRDDDTKDIADKMVDKLIKLRIFRDENDKANLSLKDVDGDLLVISQFTLYADMSHGNRPSFIRAGGPDMAEELYEYVLSKIASYGFDPKHGIFGADMKVSLLNEGPFTVMMDSDEIVKK
ncbi:MAG: D-tyrosyl-tRNA(Tyr) deacylase [Clostridiales bacterium]|nr:D-tyrosyl-tRNA(Tyr) deacylase [Clostridiales bacterium]